MLVRMLRAGKSITAISMVEKEGVTESASDEAVGLARTPVWDGFPYEGRPIPDTSCCIVNHDD